MFAILFEVLLIENQEEIHHFAGWEGGGVKGRKNCEQTFCEQTGVSYIKSGQENPINRTTHKQLSAPKSQRALRFAISMPIADPRNR